MPFGQNKKRNTQQEKKYITTKLLAKFLLEREQQVEKRILIE